MDVLFRIRYTWHMSENKNIQSAADTIVFEIHRRLKRKKPVLVALDGRSGTGKSTIAQVIASREEGSILVADDFYSGGNDEVWSGLSAQEKVAKGIDWQRMRVQALEPLFAQKTASWHPLDFKPGIGWVGWKDEMVKIEPTSVVLVDGVYSARPELSDLIDLAVLVEADDNTRRKRLIIREGQDFMQRWHALWDSAEEYYFTSICPRSSFAIVVRNDE
jgi:uridine kinase